MNWFDWRRDAGCREANNFWFHDARVVSPFLIRLIRLQHRSWRIVELPLSKRAHPCRAAFKLPISFSLTLQTQPKNQFFHYFLIGSKHVDHLKAISLFLCVISTRLLVRSFHFPHSFILSFFLSIPDPFVFFPCTQSTAMYFLILMFSKKILVLPVLY